MKLDYCGNEIEINLEVGEVVTLGDVDKEAFATSWLMNGEQGITDPETALENGSKSYMLKELENFNVTCWIDVGFTKVGEEDEYNTEVKIEYVSII